MKRMRAAWRGIAASAALVFGLGVTPLWAQNSNAASDWDVVTERLDEGGTYYLVADLETFSEELMSFIERIMQPMIRENPEAQMAVPIARAAVDQLGLDSLDDVGVSLKPSPDGVNTLKMFLHLTEEDGLFTLRGGDPGSPEAVTLAPADSVFVWVNEVDFDEMLALTEQIALSTTGEMGRSVIRQQLDQIRTRKNISIDEILSSMSGEFGSWLRFNGNVDMETPEGMLVMPKPEFAIYAKTETREAFDTIAELMRQEGHLVTIEETDAGEAYFALPSKENRFAINPVVAQWDGWLMIASNKSVLDICKEAKAGKNVLLNPTFQKLSQGAPKAYNSLAFSSPELNTAVNDVIEQVVELADDEEQVIALSMMIPSLGLGQSPNGVVFYRVNEPNGIYWEGHGDLTIMSSSQLFALPAIPVLAAIAIPNFLEASVRSKVSRTRADMRSMATAIESYYVDWNRYPAWSDDPGSNIRGPELDGERRPSFMASSPEGHARGITTPIAYLTRYPEDVFTQDERPFAYLALKWQDGRDTWLVYSPGPDQDYDIDHGSLLEKSGAISQEWLLPHSYDPTNGTVSRGDVWRTGW